MDTNRKIVQALLLKDYASLKESVFSLLYAKASLALDEARVAVANAVFNEATEQLDEDLQTPEREKQMKRRITRLKDRIDDTHNEVEAHDNAPENLGWRGVERGEKRLRKLGDKLDRARAKNAREKQSSKVYGIGGKVVKEATEQLDEVSPPDMEKMTGSKKTKASFTKQYGKRGKSVMYATAWKLHNKKAGKD